jgi:glycosyltransferase involved in cell wall biosynthesis
MRLRLLGYSPRLVQATQGQYAGADVCYAHFCHAAYLAGPWRASPVRGLRRLARELNHRFNALAESRAFHRARQIVVPSSGLARELRSQYPSVEARISVIANPVDADHFAHPMDFDRKAFRLRQNFEGEARLVSFVALGDFARKGLATVIDAIGKLSPRSRAKLGLFVVGGSSREIARYAAIAREAGVEARIRFVGMQADVRPYLWSADAFVFPSSYEIFPLVTLQAAAAGLPIIAPCGLYGVQEFLEDGKNGWCIERTTEGVQSILERLIMISNGELAEMSARARASVLQYRVPEFQRQWREMYYQMLTEQPA